MSISKTRQLRNVLRQLARVFGAEEAEGSYSCGLTFTQCHCLLEIGERQSATVAALSDILKLDKSTLSRTVDALVEQGLLVRREHADDRRFKVLRLTARGEALRGDIDARADARFRRVLNAIPRESRGPMLEYLELLVRSLDGVTRRDSV